MLHSGLVDMPYTNPVLCLPHIDQRAIYTEINYERPSTGAVQAPYRPSTGAVQAPCRRRIGAVQASVFARMPGYPGPGLLSIHGSHSTVTELVLQYYRAKQVIFNIFFVNM